MESALQQGKLAPKSQAFFVKQSRTLSDSFNQFELSLAYIAYERSGCISDQARKRCAISGSFSRFNILTCCAAVMP